MKKLSFLVLAAVLGCEQDRLVMRSGFEPLPPANRNRLVIASAVPTSAATGWLEVLDLTTGKIERAEQAISKDSIVRSFDGDKRIYVLERSPSDSLTIFDKKTLKPLFPSKSFRPENERVEVNGKQVELPANVQDLALDNFGNLVVTRYNAQNLLRLNPNSGEVLEPKVSLKEWADADTFPEMARIRNVNGRLWVALQNLDGGKERSGWTPSVPSQLARVSLRDQTAEVTATQMELKNAVTEFVPGRDGEMLMGCAGSYFDTTDGGIERLSLADGTSQGVLVGEEKLGGSIAALASGGGKAYAIVWTLQGSQLVSVDLETGEVTKGSAPTKDDNLFHLVYDDERQLLFLANGNIKQPAVLVLDAETLTEKTRIPVELFPMGLVLTD